MAILRSKRDVPTFLVNGRRMARDVLYYRWEGEAILAMTSETQERHSIPFTTSRVNEKAFTEEDYPFESF